MSFQPLVLIHSPRVPMTKLTREIIFYLRLIVSVGILAYLITVFDWVRVIEVLGKVRFSYFWPAPLLLLLALYFGGIRWSVVLHYFSVRLSAWEGFLYYLIGSFYGNILPGVIGGDAVRIAICRSSKKSSLTEIAASVLIERLCGVLALLVMGTIAVTLLSATFRFSLGLAVVMLVPTLAGISLVIGIWGYLFFGKVFGPWLTEIADRGNRIAKTVLRIINSIRKISLTGMSVIFLLSSGFQFTDILISFFLAKAINIDVPLLFFLAIFPIVYILTVLPISLGGLGVREGALAYLMTRVGILPSDAVMLSFLIYLNRVFVSLTGGGLQVFWKPALERKNTAPDAIIKKDDIVL